MSNLTLKLSQVPDEYIDPCDLLIHAMFEVLCLYVDECGGEEEIRKQYAGEYQPDENEPEEMREQWNDWQKSTIEAADLFHWYTVDRPTRTQLQAPMEDWIQHSTVYTGIKTESSKEVDKWLDDINEQEDQWNKEDTQMMGRLLAIKNYLWM